MAASGIFQTRKSRTHQYFTNQKNMWRIIVFTGARKPENQLSLALFAVCQKYKTRTYGSFQLMAN